MLDRRIAQPRSIALITPALPTWRSQPYWLIFVASQFRVLVAWRRSRLFANRNVAILESKATDAPTVIYYQLIDGADGSVTHSRQVVALYVIIEHNDTFVG
jgi:hypothetical protein